MKALTSFLSIISLATSISVFSQNSPLQQRLECLLVNDSLVQVAFWYNTKTAEKTVMQNGVISLSHRCILKAASML
jgi:hypothetical protein